MRYLSFRLQVVSRSETTFEVFAWSPAGEGRGTFDLEVNQMESEALAAQLLTSWLSPPRPESVQGRWRRPEEAGEWLFDLVFRGEVLALYQRSLDLLGTDSNLGLRIELASDPRESSLRLLHSLPWELMRQPGTADFLALNRRRPVVRYSTLPLRVRPLAVEAKLRVMVVLSKPQGQVPLDLGRELENLREALGSQNEIDLVYPEAPTLEALRAGFRERPCQVLHFMGHGGISVDENGILLFENGDGGAQQVRGDDLANKLADLPGLRLVFLNACYSAAMTYPESYGPLTSVALSMVTAGVPAVLAMQYRISDRAAIQFSRGFYACLGRGEPVEAAVTEGRQAMHSSEPDTAEWVIPVLYLRGAESDVGPLKWRAKSYRRAVAAAVVFLALLGLASLAFRQARAHEALALNNKGYERLAHGRLDEARTSLMAALRIDPRFPPALANLSALESASGNEEAALELAKAAADAEPTNALYHYNYGQLLAQTHRYEEAQRALQTSLQIDPSYAAARNELGRVYLALGRLPEARHSLELGLAAEPELAALHRNLGFVALAEAKVDEARANFTEGLRLARRGADKLGVCEALEGLVQAELLAANLQAACDRFDELQRSDPTDALCRLKDRELAGLADCPAGRS